MTAWRRMGLPERIAVVMLAAITLVAVLAPWLTPYDPFIRVAEAFLPPSWPHPFGTDEIGRDLLSRVILGVRLTWLPGLAIILISLCIGALVGLLAGALGGIARARGMTQLAKDTGLSRESLYRSLSGERAPSSDTLFKVLKAMGLQLSVQPAKVAKTA